MAEDSEIGYEEALLQKRLECVKRLKGQLDVESSIAAETMALYTSVIEGEIIAS